MILSGGGVFAVAPDALVSAANTAESVADACDAVGAQVNGVLAAVATLGGLDLATAVGDAISGWEKAIRDRRDGVRGAAEALRSTAASYAAAEDRIANSINRVHRALI
jgi:uncharacterized protein YukE